VAGWAGGKVAGQGLRRLLIDRAGRLCRMAGNTQAGMPVAHRWNRLQAGSAAGVGPEFFAEGGEGGGGAEAVAEHELRGAGDVEIRVPVVVVDY
jgi:hypothetical protein